MGAREILGLVKVNIFWSCGDSTASVTQWWKENAADGPLDATVTPLGAAVFAQSVAEHLDSAVESRRPTSSFLTGAKATVYTNSHPEVSGTWDAHVPGTATADISLPPQCSAVMSLHTGYSGRSYRGRNYLPYLASAVDPLDLDAPYEILHQDYITDVQLLYPVGLNLTDASTLSHSMELVVWSPTLQVAHYVTNVTMDSRIDTMRSRNP